MSRNGNGAVSIECCLLLTACSKKVECRVVRKTVRTVKCQKGRRKFVYDSASEFSEVLVFNSAQL